MNRRVLTYFIVSASILVYGILPGCKSAHPIEKFDWSGQRLSTSSKMPRLTSTYPRSALKSVTQEATLESWQPMPLHIGEYDTLALSEALQLSFRHHPQLAAYDWQLREMEARQLQARLRPNPRISYGIDSFARPNTNGFQSHSLRLSQLVELAGKRRKRIAVATSNQKLAAWDYEQTRLQVLTDTTLAYIDVMAAQKHLELVRQNLELVKSAAAIVNKRVNRGRLAEVERDKSQVRLSLEHIALASALTRLANSREILQAQWGERPVKFKIVQGNWDEQAGEKLLKHSVDRLLKFAQDHPKLARWQDEFIKGERALSLAQARRIENVTVGAGVKHFPGDEEAGGILELSMPLPLTNRNQGEVLRAKYALFRIDRMASAAKAQVLKELHVLHANLKVHAHSRHLLVTQTLPAADRAYQASIKAFEKGATSYLEVLDAQRSLLELRLRTLEVRRNYHRTLIKLESLIGVDVASEPVEQEST